MQDNNPSSGHQAQSLHESAIQPPIIGMPVTAASMPAPRSAGKSFLKPVITVAAVLVLGGAAFAGYQIYGQSQNKLAPGPAAISLAEVETALGDVDDSFEDIDANMIGLEAGLADQMGDLSE